MRFHGPHSRFELTLVGRPDHDGWCGVRVAIAGPDGHWTGESRCLLADEITRLAAWLEGGASGTRFETLDNEIGFEMLDTEPRQVRVYLEWPFRPVRERSADVGSFHRDYPVTERLLRQAAGALREQLRLATPGSRG
jgi:hypothetical protein